ncbi:MAG TPA: sarcosine oxidase subunit gamma family protein [Steroidobacteraceae bacterium]|nr:sarcosine oxidase subunit gamma family protein [Steroidobacteraceae bacterium]
MREAADIRIAAIERRSVWQIKTWLASHDEAARAMFEAQGLSRRVGETSAAFGGRALTLGPQEWLVVGEALRLEREPVAQDWIAVNVTDAFGMLEVQGASARELLSKGCGLDLHPRVFRVGQCARTRFAQLPIVLTCVGHADRFELLVARSYTRYLRDWLVDAATGCGEVA